MKPKSNKIRPFNLQIFADCDIITEFLKRNRFPSVQELEKMKPEEFKDAVIEFRYRLYDPNEREQFGYDRTAKEGTIAEFLKRETFLNPNSLERMDRFTSMAKPSVKSSDTIQITTDKRIERRKRHFF